MLHDKIGSKPEMTTKLCIVPKKLSNTSAIHSDSSRAIFSAHTDIAAMVIISLHLTLNCNKQSMSNHMLGLKSSQKIMGTVCKVDHIMVTHQLLPLFFKMGVKLFLLWFILYCTVSSVVSNSAHFLTQTPLTQFCSSSSKVVAAFCFVHSFLPYRDRSFVLVVILPWLVLLQKVKQLHPREAAVITAVMRKMRRCFQQPQ